MLFTSLDLAADEICRVELPSQTALSSSSSITPSLSIWITSISNRLLPSLSSAWYGWFSVSYIPCFDSDTCSGNIDGLVRYLLCQVLCWLQNLVQDCSKLARIHTLGIGNNIGNIPYQSRTTSKLTSSRSNSRWTSSVHFPPKKPLFITA